MPQTICPIPNTSVLQKDKANDFSKNMKTCFLFRCQSRKQVFSVSHAKKYVIGFERIAQKL